MALARYPTVRDQLGSLSGRQNRMGGSDPDGPRPPAPTSIVAQRPSSHPSPHSSAGAGPGQVVRIPNAPANRPSHPANPSAGTGLNVNDKTPFNVFAMPKTVGQFNSEVNKLAAPSYQPQLDQNSADIQAEDTANKMRNSDISSIYSQYGAQAAQAFQEAKDAINSLVASNASGDQASQANLQAALNSAGGPGAQVSAMMGLGPGGGSGVTLPYMSAAQGLSGSAGNELKGMGASELGLVGQGMTNAATEQASQATTESTRHGAALETLHGNRDAIVASIPSLVEKAREQLITELQSAHGLQFQEQLAGKQFGLSAETTHANISNANRAADLNAKIAQANIRDNTIKLAQSGESLQLQKNQVDNAAVVDKAKLAQALATAQGKQDANALKFLAGWVTPTKADIVPGHYTYATDPRTGATVKTYVNPSIDQKTWHKDPGMALRALMTTYGLGRDQALGLMSSLTMPIGGQWGKMTIGEWAASFKQRLSQQKAAPYLTFPQLQRFFPTVGGTLSSAGNVPRL